MTKPTFSQYSEWNIYLILLVMLLSGCGQIAYKRGANAANFDQDKAICQDKNQTESAIESCLKEQGWYVQNLDNIDDAELFATASVSDNRPTSSSTETKKLPESSASQKSTKKSVTAENTTEGVADKTSYAQNNAKAEEKHDPLEKYAINSWWKMGAGPQALEKDTAACVAALGSAHQPNFKTQEYTRGVIICMREKGWRALKKR